MTQEQLTLLQLKNKNNKIKSKYIHLHECNIGRERLMVTFTTPKIKDSVTQLIQIDEIRKFFIKRLQNLKADIQYFTAIELGKSFNNPHLHIQLYFNKKDVNRIDDAYLKTLNQFKLNKKRNKITKMDSSISKKTSFNYPIKESDNKQQSNENILKRDKARKKIKSNDIKAENIKFHTSSRSLLPHPLYKKLWFEYGIGYNGVNELVKCGYVVKFTNNTLILMKEIFKDLSDYIVFKNGAIKLKIEELYQLILFPFLVLYLISIEELFTLILFPFLVFHLNEFKSRSSELPIYCNKSKKKWVFKINSNEILYNLAINTDKGLKNGYERVRYRYKRRTVF